MSFEAKQPLEDSDPMPWGLHKGKAMELVPANYLIWLFENDKCGISNVKHYIIDNMDVLKKEIDTKVELKKVVDRCHKCGKEISDTDNLALVRSFLNGNAICGECRFPYPKK